MTISTDNNDHDDDDEWSRIENNDSSNLKW